MFAINEQVRYVEFKEGADVKRFVFPVEESLINKINSLSKIPTLSIVNMGTGTVKEKIISGASGAKSTLESVPSGVNDMFTIHFDNHPDVTHGSARYSHALLTHVSSEEEQQEVAVTLTEEVVVPLPLPAPVMSLTEQLKQQVKGPDANPDQMTLDDFKKEMQNLPANVTKLPSLEEKLAEVKKTKQTTPSPTPFVPTGSIMISEELGANIMETLRIVKAIDRSYNGEQKEITGRELARWFHENAFKDGSDQAWNYIASKVHDW